MKIGNVFLLALLLPVATWAAHPTVEIKTNLGSFEVELYNDKAPITVENFMQYVREGYYRDTLLHRLVPHVLLQGGLYGSDWRQRKTRPPIANEADNSLSNSKWSVAMVRGKEPDSATSEFFINLNDNTEFDFTGEGNSTYYCVFGEISSGHDTLKKMIEAGVIQGGDFVGDQPTHELIIEDIHILNEY